jgi:hypothetical protein
MKQLGRPGDAPVICNRLEGLQLSEVHDGSPSVKYQFRESGAIHLLAAAWRKSINAAFTEEDGCLIERGRLVRAQESFKSDFRLAYALGLIRIFPEKSQNRV